ncbi:hypothetical protein [Methylobacterium sp. Leaf93]|uniref:hypothetical protein n=1 Tax=Methylobacterium sp. Leaf93 TaxID=1736249 RepID=UPI0006FD7812|nr:hypothetical protein [Methylobacterium sp. Leaf93]KQP03386.1 hypothetical protein ASF26_13910 [Methylobacterium sp. Leaf93]
MNPNTRRWIISGIFGLIAGWAMGGVIVPAVSALLGVMVRPAPGPRDAAITWPGPAVDVLPFLTVGLQATVVIVVTLLLARVAEERRRVGWGCLAVGGAILLNGIVLLAVTGVLGWLLDWNPSDGASGGEASAGFFLLLLGLPYGLLCIGLLVSGVILLRRRPSLPLQEGGPGRSAPR